MKKNNVIIKRLKRLNKKSINMKKTASNSTELINLFNKMQSAIVDKKSYDFCYETDEFFDDDFSWIFTAECNPYNGSITIYSDGYDEESDTHIQNNTTISSWDFLGTNEQEFLSLCYDLQKN